MKNYTKAIVFFILFICPWFLLIFLWFCPRGFTPPPVRFGPALIGKWPSPLLGLSPFATHTKNYLVFILII